MRTLQRSIAYGACALGYEVYLIGPNGTEVEITAGNSHFDSVNIFDPRDGPTVPHQTLRKYARQQAIELAEAYNVPLDMIEYNRDIAQTMRDEWEGNL